MHDMAYDRITYNKAKDVALEALSRAKDSEYVELKTAHAAVARAAAEVMKACRSNG